MTNENSGDPSAAQSPPTANPYASPTEFKKPQPMRQSGMSSHMKKQTRAQTGCAMAFFISGAVFAFLMGVAIYSTPDVNGVTFQMALIVAGVFWFFSASLVLLAVVHLLAVSNANNPSSDE